MKNNEIVNEIRKVIKGKDSQIVKVLLAILAKGHILIEDVPGVGKTTLALAFSKAMGLSSNRIQFTPDVLPSDIVGFSIYNSESKQFEYNKGAVFCNLLLADEINRTSPKTQSALLETMEEKKVTVDGKTRKIDDPFIVIATENPVGSAGTQLLPESELDRFIIKITMGYPDEENEIEMLKSKQNESIENVNTIYTDKDIIKMQKEVEEVYICDEIYKYVVKLVALTRNSEMIDLGLSPRATIAICNMAKANAYLNGRDFVIADDILFVFKDVSVHRIILNPRVISNSSVSNDDEVEKILDDIIKKVQIPSIN